MRCNLHDYDIMEDGIRQGKQEAKLETARNFLLEGDSIEKIARCTGLSLETVQQLAEELKATTVQ